MISARLVEKYRRALALVAEETGSLMWTGIRELEAAGVTGEAMRDAVSQLSYDVITHMGDGTAVVAGDFYDAIRLVEVGETAATYMPFGPTREEVDQSVRRSARFLFDREGPDGRIYGADVDAFGREVQDTTERFVLNYARDAVVESSFYDPVTPRWSRVARPDSCGYCRGQMEAGWTWPTKSSADSTFFHTHCRCLTVPSWDEWPTVEGVPDQKVEPGDTGRASSRQMSALFARLSDSQVTDRLAWASHELGRTVSSFSDLSYGEVSRLLSKLGLAV